MRLNGRRKSSVQAMNKLLKALFGANKSKIEDAPAAPADTDLAKYTLTLVHDPTRVYPWNGDVEGPNGFYKCVSSDTEQGAKLKAKEVIDVQASKKSTQTLRGDEL